MVHAYMGREMQLPHTIIIARNIGLIYIIAKLGQDYQIKRLTMLVWQQGLKGSLEMVKSTQWVWLMLDYQCQVFGGGSPLWFRWLKITWKMISSGGAMPSLVASAILQFCHSVFTLWGVGHQTHGYYIICTPIITYIYVEGMIALWCQQIKIAIVAVIFTTWYFLHHSTELSLSLLGSKPHNGRNCKKKSGERKEGVYGSCSHTA